MMNRRRFLCQVALGFVAAPLAAGAQQADKIPRIGFLIGASAAVSAPYVEVFRQGLSELGYVEGRNIAIEYRWADGNYERLPALADDRVTLLTHLYAFYLDHRRCGDLTSDVEGEPRQLAVGSGTDYWVFSSRREVPPVTSYSEASENDYALAHPIKGNSGKSAR